MMLEGYNIQINLLLDKLATLADSKLSKILVFLSFQINKVCGMLMTEEGEAVGCIRAGRGGHERKWERRGR
jgi:hypothetical protein